MRMYVGVAMALCAVCAAGPGQAGDLLFLHHSVGQNWLDSGLRDVLAAKGYIGEVNEVTYGSEVDATSGRPESLGSVPGDSTDMNHWVPWFNDYLHALKQYGCASGSNSIIMFKSCFPNSAISSDGTEPGDPFSGDKTLANYKAVFRHPSGAGHVYSANSSSYKALDEVFAENTGTLFVVVTAPPLHYAPGDATNNAEGHRARLFNNWLKNEWLTAYETAHPGVHNVAVFDLFGELAYADSHLLHPNRLQSAYGGTSGDSHPNNAGDQHLTDVFARNDDDFLDAAWTAFGGAGEGESEGESEGEGEGEGEHHGCHGNGGGSGPGDLGLLLATLMLLGVGGCFPGFSRRLARARRA